MSSASWKHCNHDTNRYSTHKQQCKRSAMHAGNANSATKSDKCTDKTHPGWTRVALHIDTFDTYLGKCLCTQAIQFESTAGQTNHNSSTCAFTTSCQQMRCAITCAMHLRYHKCVQKRAEQQRNLTNHCINRRDKQITTHPHVHPPQFANK